MSSGKMTKGGMHEKNRDILPCAEAEDCLRGDPLAPAPRLFGHGAEARRSLPGATTVRASPDRNANERPTAKVKGGADDERSAHSRASYISSLRPSPRKSDPADCPGEGGARKLLLGAFGVCKKPALADGGYAHETIRGDAGCCSQGSWWIPLPILRPLTPGGHHGKRSDRQDSRRCSQRRVWAGQPQPTIRECFSKVSLRVRTAGRGSFLTWIKPPHPGRFPSLFPERSALLRNALSLAGRYALRSSCEGGNANAEILWTHPALFIQKTPNRPEEAPARRRPKNGTSCSAASFP